MQNILNKKMLTALIALLSLIFASASSILAADDYISHITKSVESLETGNCPEALDHIEKALSYETSDLLAWVLLGTTLLMGDAANAQTQINYALTLDDNCAEAHYLLGIFELKKKNIIAAQAHFDNAARSNPDLDISSSKDYISWLNSEKISEYDKTNELSSSIYALALMRDVKYAEAFEILKDLQEKAIRPGFGERIGFSCTFTRSEPMTITGWPLGKRTFSQKPASKVSGKLTLQADITNAQRVTMVTFTINNKLVSVTNVAPFQYSWNTNTVPNGRYSILIQGIDDVGVVLTETSADVIVENENPQVTVDNTRTGDKALLWQRVWNIIKLKPSAAFINYNVASTAQTETPLAKQIIAETALERVLAADPNYLDSQEKLVNLYGRKQKYGNIYKVESNKKLLALTFDDGPKERTHEILDILKEKDVKATFFLVGTQVQLFPDIVKRISDEGHDIQNHTYSHRTLEYLTEKEIIQELFKNIALVRAITGKGMQYMRPPGGHEGKILPEVLKRFGIDAVYWTVNASKYEGSSQNEFSKNITSQVNDAGSIILLHNPESVTILALSEIIDTLKGKGFAFATLSDLLAN